MKEQNKNFWENKYNSGNLGWDIGYASPPLTAYLDQLPNKDIKILIPGAGNAYELLYLVQHGFKNVYIVDIAKAPLDRIKMQLPNYPEDQLIEGDFFDLDLTGFDLIIEQTFFCAIAPSLRPQYVLKIKELLRPKGKLVGLFFTFPLTESGPPYGGSITEYKAHFSDYFQFKVLETAYNSIKPREDKELFFIFESK
ncbi:Thiopurine S-methyltransferase [Arenibacter antarcticus]|uniref:Methyltransferase domain-containing protein n=1 Tax=Arenibacter antarcticus TaxID=2040469 RepID=A0ABW5VCJ0_9FLAO|nr:methyltransferase domain-containing protein [Arenibacter sp. H213]MCM4169538.1 SAM-dependent methyltransferase [Arenibacter sp. H213]